jgi:hypothetical protein
MDDAESKEQQRRALYEAWLRHIEETPKHPRPAAEGGSAHYDMNVAATHIECCVDGCDWATTIPLEEIMA